jgi:hypothetical protein
MAHEAGVVPTWLGESQNSHGQQAKSLGQRASLGAERRPTLHSTNLGYRPRTRRVGPAGCRRSTRLKQAAKGGSVSWCCAPALAGEVPAIAGGVDKAGLVTVR